MNAHLIEQFFECLACRGPLRVVDEALISCSACSATVAIRAGVPRFVPESNYADSFGYQWNIHRRTQLDSYTGLPISRNRLFEVTGWPYDLTDQTVMEAGSGAGRFTEVLLGSGAKVISFDYSSAVDANFANNGEHPNLCLFQGNIFDIPVRTAAIDKVMCLGVLQHTPDPHRAFKNLASHVRPGGDLVIDLYGKRLVSMLHWRFLLRPLTKRMDQERLYRAVSRLVPPLVPFTAFLRRVGGRAGARLSPISEYAHLGLSPEMNCEWAILDTFDMYSPAHDHPQSLQTVERWFREVGFEDVQVRYGPNGVIGRGRRPHG
ncbi:MAG TPA: class I SAM-dependent methyltransferase [Burkholderiales bacterium]|nr:class I SAM-dependent methyltransferase [Burkholderiales bacterium]